MSRRLGFRTRKHKRNPAGEGISLRGREGKPFRIALYCVVGVLFVFALLFLGRPKNQLMNSAEIRRITDRGVLVVGVRDDIPSFAYNGEGLEIELAKLFAEYLFPESGSETAVKLVTVSGQTASTKLSDGSIDAAIALMPKGASSKYAYSYSYYTDSCRVAVRPGLETAPLDSINIGYVQNTAGASVLSSYIDEHETKVERTLLDRIKGRTPELPEDAVVFTKTAFASYPDMLKALSEGRIDGAAMTGVYIERYAGEAELTLHNTPLGTVNYAIAVSADEPAIARLADVFIYELSQSGRLDALLAKYGLSGGGKTGP